VSVPTDVTLRRLGQALAQQDGLLADALHPGMPGGSRPPGGAAPADEPGLGALAAAGPRSEGRRDDVAFVVEAIREGYLLHYATGRLLRDDDRDLMLLAGDHLYALGLERLAGLGDLGAVSELADVISLGAQAQAEHRADLAEAAWEAGAAAVGWGADDGLRAAKAAARAGEAGAAAALRAAARRVSGGAARVR
jgi:hypothetical protein